MDYKGRQLRIQSLLRPNRVDALLITHLPNVRYLSGFTGSSAVIVLTEAQSLFFTDGRYTTQAREEVHDSRVMIGRKGPLPSAAEWLLTHSGKKSPQLSLGFEAEHLTVAARTRIAKILGSAAKLKPAPPLVEQARTIKDAEEIKLLRAAVQMGSNLFPTILNGAKPGVTENQVAAELEYAARQSGAEQMSFATIIASGKRSALPHGIASATPIHPKGFMVCDFGVILAGYCSDMTRTVHMGNPTAEAKQIYETVLNAQRAAVQAVKPGTTVAEVDEAARKLLKKNGLSKYFTHSTGHGVGLEIHEPPRIAAGQTDVLKAGMVITIEPGVYIPQSFGIRIEDMVLVTENGCEVLTPTTKELITL